MRSSPCARNWRVQSFCAELYHHAHGKLGGWCFFPWRTSRPGSLCVRVRKRGWGGGGEVLDRPSSARPLFFPPNPATLAGLLPSFPRVLWSPRWELGIQLICGRGDGAHRPSHDSLQCHQLRWQGVRGGPRGRARDSALALVLLCGFWSRSCLSATRGPPRCHGWRSAHTKSN